MWIISSSSGYNLSLWPLICKMIKVTHYNIFLILFDLADITDCSANMPIILTSFDIFHIWFELPKWYSVWIPADYTWLVYQWHILRFVVAIKHFFRRIISLYIIWWVFFLPPSNTLIFTFEIIKVLVYALFRYRWWFMFFLYINSVFIFW